MAEPEVQATPPLLLDGRWKQIQQNTFTRWANQHLATVGLSVDDLETDLSDGIRLIKLIEVLAGRPVTQRFNKTPNLRTQKLDNIQQALNFLEKEEGIKLVTIDSMHIADGNLKLILGLIWTLILHYSISMASADQAAAKGQSPKQRLLQWIRQHLPEDVPVTNFTSDWNDGVALGALVDGLAPGSCADWRQWRPDDALANTQRAMSAAEQCLGVGRLLTPEELINPNVDERSVMTFLSQFPRAQPPPSGHISNVEAEPVVGRETHFTVDVGRPNLRPVVQIVDSDGADLETEIRPIDSAPHHFDVAYSPRRIGRHDIQVAAAAGDSQLRLGALSVRAVPAPCLVDFKPECEVGEVQRFRVANLAEKNLAEVLVLDPRGNRVNAEPQGRVGATVGFTFTPETAGLHSVNVFVDRRHIPGSPLGLHVRPTAAARAHIWGRGVVPTGTRVGDQLPIHVDGCDRPVLVSVQNKDDVTVHCQQTADGKDRKSFAYSPLGTGPHTVSVTCDGQHIGQSPYTVDVAPKSNWAIRAVGPGVEGGRANQPAVFYVDTKGEASVLEFSTEGPSQSEIQSEDNGDSTALVTFKPTKEGVYKVNVLNQGEHIHGSPFVVMIDPDDQRPQSTAVVTPIGAEDAEIRAREPFSFVVESAVDPKVKIYDPDLQPVDRFQMAPLSTQPGAQKVTFTPPRAGKYVVSVVEDKVAVAETPFSIEVSKAVDLSKLHVYGPGVGSNVHSGHPTSFLIDARDVGCRKIDVELLGPTGAVLDAQVVSTGANEPISVAYTPQRAGPHKAKIYADGELAFDMSIDVAEAPASRRTSRSSSMSENDRLNRSGQPIAGQDASLHLMLNNVDPAQLKARLQSPDGHSEDIPLIHAGGNHYTINFRPKSDGVHTIDVYHRGQLIEGSPFRVPVAAFGRSRANLVRAEGKGLESGQVGRSQSFVVYLGEAGGGELRASINGPSRADITLTDFQDGVCRAEYSTTEPGLYTISVTLDDAPIHRSPFKVFIAPAPPSTVSTSNTVQLGASARPPVPAATGTLLSAQRSISTDAEGSEPEGRAQREADSRPRELEAKRGDWERKPLRPGLEDEWEIDPNVYAAAQNQPEAQAGQITERADFGSQRRDSDANAYDNYSKKEAAVAETQPLEVRRLDAHSENRHQRPVSPPQDYQSHHRHESRDSNGYSAAKHPNGSVTANGTQKPEFQHSDQTRGFHIQTTVGAPPPIHERESIFAARQREAQKIDEPVQLRSSPSSLDSRENLPPADSTTSTTERQFTVQSRPGIHTELRLDPHRHSGALPSDSDSLREFVAVERSLQRDAQPKPDSPSAFPTLPVERNGAKPEVDQRRTHLSERNRTEERIETKVQRTVSAEAARRVAADGAGLYEFVPGEVAHFTVNTSKAGRSFLFVGVVTSKGPSEEVLVRHCGGGRFDVSYIIPEHTRALVLIKYGDRDILGSPFTVRPAQSPRRL